MAKQAQMLLQQAMQLLQSGHLDQAEDAGRKAAEMLPGSADAQHILAVILHQQKRSGEALELIERAVKIDPANPARHNDMGEILREVGRVQEAEIAYRNAIRLDPKFTISHNSLGICLHIRGDEDAARECYKKALSLAPEYAEANMNLGSSWVDAGNFKEAEVYLRAAVKAQPRNLQALKLLGLCCLKQQQLDDAIYFNEMAAALSQNDAGIKSTLAKAYSAAGLYEKAIEHLQQAIVLEPEKEEHHFHLADALKSSGRMEEALPHLQMALKLRPRSHEIANNLGNLLRSMGRVSEAEDILRQAIQWEPTYSPPYNNLGMICIETDRVVEAFECFKEAFRLNPASAEALGNLGNTYRHMGDFDAAKTHYAKALEIRPDYPSARFSYSITQLCTGDFEAGWANYRYRQGAMELVPERFLQQPLPEDLEGKRLYIAYDQGIGDEIFFLRFAEELKRRGAWIAYRSFPKIASLLSRCPFVDMQVGAEELQPDAYDQSLWVCDLAYAVGMKNDTPPPSSIRLRSMPGARKAVARRLAAIGDGPYLGLTWRAGTSRDVATPWRALCKEVSLEMLAKTLHGYPGRIFILQRNPKPEEIELFERLSGCRVHDFSDLNDNLEQMLALLDELDEHVCVSNTNVHLRAALGKTSRVIIPNPPDWRWMTSGESPWFPGCPTYRQQPDGDWNHALKQLRSDLVEASNVLDGREWAKEKAPVEAKHPTVLWLTMGDFKYNFGELVSPFASTRYRVLIPMRELKRKGFQVQIQGFSDAHAVGVNLGAEYVVISKTLNPDDIKIVRQAQKHGAKLILDLCDNHFENPEIGAFHRELLEISKVVVASTPEMARVIKQEVGRDAVVISDPYEGRRGRPQFYSEGGCLKLLWFGNPNNLDALVMSLPRLSDLAPSQALQLEIVTRIDPEVEYVFRSQNMSRVRKGFNPKLTPWSIENNADALARCDLVIIPTLLSKQKVMVKSPNRVIESLWAGRFVLAGDIPAYQEFRDWVWIGEDIKVGIEWALTHRDEIPERISAAQKYISQYYSPEVIGQQWEKIFEA